MTQDDAQAAQQRTVDEAGRPSSARARTHFEAEVERLAMQARATERDQLATKDTDAPGRNE